MLAPIGLAPNPLACITNSQQSIGLSGYTFLITETNCDTLAKTDSVSVFVSKAGESKRDLIFEYDPSERGPIPKFVVDRQGNISVSIPAVSTIFVHKRNWNGQTIAYDVGKEYDPETGNQPSR